MDQLPHGPIGWLFWLFGALVLDWIADYSKPYLDKLFDSLSASRKFRSQKAKALFNKRVEELLIDPVEATNCYTKMSQHLISGRLLAASMLIITISYSILSHLPLSPNDLKTYKFLYYFTSAAATILFLITLKTAAEQSRILNDYRRRKREQRQQEENALAGVTIAKNTDSP